MDPTTVNRIRLTVRADTVALKFFSVVGQIPFRQETFGSEDSAGERSLS